MCPLRVHRGVNELSEFVDTACRQADLLEALAHPRWEAQRLLDMAATWPAAEKSRKHQPSDYAR